MKYSKHIVDKICSIIAEDDYTVEEVCLQVGISRETYFEWKRTKPYFSDRIKKAQEQRLEVFKKAADKGMLILLEGKEFEEVTTEYKEVKVGVDKDGLPIFKPRMIAQKKVKKFIMPNAATVIFTKKNLDGDNFKDIIKQEHTGADGKPIKTEVVTRVVFKSFKGERDNT